MEKTGKITLSTLIIISIVGFVGFLVAKDIDALTIGGSEIERISTTAEVLTDDSIAISETLYYNTDDINGVRRSYNYQSAKHERIDIDAVYVDGVESVPVHSAHNGDSGVYTFADYGFGQELKIYQQTSGITQFKINYRIYGAVKEYKDVQDVKWDIYDARDGSMPQRLDATIKFPVNLAGDQAYVFGHGDLQGDVRKENDNTVRVDITRFYSNTFAEVRVLLPGTPIPNVHNHSSEAQLDNFLTYEKGEAEKTEQLVAANAKRRERTEWVLLLEVCLWLFIVVFLFGLFRLLYLKYDAEKYTFLLEYYREVPSSSPAVSARILDSDALTGQAQFIATIFSLYTKKLINLRTLHKDVAIDLVNREKDITSYQLSKDEFFVYEWLIDSFGETKEGTYKRFFNIGNRSKQAAKTFEKQFTSFENIVLTEYRKLDFEKRNGASAKWPWSLSIGLTGLAICLVLIAPLAISQQVGFEALVLMGALTALFVIAFSLLVWYQQNAYQLTEEGAREKAQVKGLKKYLNNYSFLKDADVSAVHLWEQYFVYGLALGVSKHALNKLYQHMPRATVESPDWQTFYMMHYLSHNYNIVHRSQGAVQTMAQRTGASVSRSGGGSSFGGGGGFSGGGGGGFGGGGSSSF